MNLRERLRAALPTAETLQRSRWLRPVAHRLGERALWRLRSESVARGVAVGLFWAFAIPVAQIVFAAMHCVWWRANIPVAAAATLITNPFTVGGWLYLAYQAGSAVLAPWMPSEARGWLATVGGPTMLGMGLFAAGSAVAGYLLVRGASLAWWWWKLTRRRWRRAR